ncbi:AbrB/MazE/SpoVT family DNA-binding domain-containing protein [Paracoccus sp. MC1854]|uniref:AbrB/MazE/SpoVT family DNA-binding domain-containing protein n=1 Tax=Paracoccus sp. MC1854 TaxID=2760306 RepID=UPI00160173FC|nr:AbrB/MazE/SpoVT family DNA-binding domain-containing protein [Paracoccus sp. MC1854]MBB1493145.1 AbrB/MazE/SpoVT family DNA-binding domain-containing protein [Paracoccus sp. MC1854]
MASVLRIAETGRLNIPMQIRNLVGLERGGQVSVWVEDGEIRVRPVRDVMAALQAEAADLFANTNESVDLFLAERREEAEREEQS